MAIIRPVVYAGGSLREYAGTAKPGRTKKHKSCRAGDVAVREKSVIVKSVVAERVFYSIEKIYLVSGDRAAASLIDVLHYKGIAKDDWKELVRVLGLFLGGGALIS